MAIDANTLESLDLFNELMPDELETLAGLAEHVRISEGEIITRRTEPAHIFYVTLSGNYMIYFKEGRAFTLHGSGCIIGMSTVLTPFRYRATTVALTDGEAVSMSGDKFLKLVQSNALLGEKMMRKINDIIGKRPICNEAATKKMAEAG